MVAAFTAEQILYATNGHLAAGVIDASDGRVVWDVNDVEPGDWFLEIPSELCPADSLSLALSKGARGCIVTRRARYLVGNASTLFAVPDTKSALLELVRYWRCSVAPRVVGVAGSQGRRATMILLHQLVKDKFKSHIAFMGSLGWFGCMKEVLAMPHDTDLLIFEAGAVERGDIVRLGGALRPDLAILTRTGHPLPSPERDAATASIYCELLETLSDDGRVREAIVAYDDNLAVRNRLEQVIGTVRAVRLSEGVQTIVDKIPDTYVRELSDRMKIAVGLPVSRAELWCAIESALTLGVTAQSIMDILELEQFEKASSVLSGNAPL